MDDLESGKEKAMRKKDSVDFFLSLPVLQSDVLKQDFAYRLESILKKEKISKKELAKTLNTSSAWVSKVLRGDANLTIDTMCKLVEAVGYQLGSFSIKKTA